MMVLMAIVTRILASPVFEWVYGRRAGRTGKLGALQEALPSTAPESPRALEAPEVGPVSGAAGIDPPVARAR